MNNKFVPYHIALRLKNIGFKEECLGVYLNDLNEVRYEVFNKKLNFINDNSSWVTAPLWQDAFDWFVTKKYSSYIIIRDDNIYWRIIILADKTGTAKGYSGYSNNILEGRINCLDQLLKCVEKQNNTLKYVV